MMIEAAVMGLSYGLLALGTVASFVVGLLLILPPLVWLTVIVTHIIGFRGKNNEQA